MKRVFGMFELVFDLAYLLFGIISIFIFFNGGAYSHVRMLAGIMTSVLIIGDAFHLLPRIGTILVKDERRFRTALGIGKLITSVSMTIFYLFLWTIAKTVFSLNFIYLDIPIYILALLRILLCFMPQNKWKDRFPPLKWGIYRNVPFFILGTIVSLVFFMNQSKFPSFRYMYLAIILSFLFYLPVVLYANKNPKVGMLMLPKTCTYLWIVTMCFSL